MTYMIDVSARRFQLVRKTKLLEVLNDRQKIVKNERLRRL